MKDNFDDYDDEGDADRPKIPDKHKQELKAEFLTIMQEKFLKGDDIKFDYRCVNIPIFYYILRKTYLKVTYSVSSFKVWSQSYKKFSKSQIKLKLKGFWLADFEIHTQLNQSEPWDGRNVL